MTLSQENVYNMMYVRKQRKANSVPVKRTHTMNTHSSAQLGSIQFHFNSLHLLSSHCLLIPFFIVFYFSFDCFFLLLPLPYILHVHFNSLSGSWFVCAFSVQMPSFLAHFSLRFLSLAHKWYCRAIEQYSKCEKKKRNWYRIQHGTCVCSSHHETTTISTKSSGKQVRKCKTATDI